ncbi:amino acid permease [Bacteroides sp. 214]|uniref:amino acid permease n=1 Tax=Bacteroides sp. 214 TaxID=2302935 RepID=UPI0013D39868|nr:amino acid permease [Bacteroides sp. 214]NDW12199.1 amino acid permease [Bacteroides sp. 214]
MKNEKAHTRTTGFGAPAVFLTSISSILGAILFLRMGYATGELGFFGILFIIILGHLITVPTALAISELATNTRVEGGGEYFIISRSFGLKLGSTIGVTLFLSQTISIAFYTIAFAEAFQPLFDWFASTYGYDLPKQVISVPTLLILGYLILTQGSGSGMKLLYVVNFLLLVSFIFFFLGKPVSNSGAAEFIPDSFGFFNMDKFFIVFAICFPAFTGMTAGVGLSGDLKNPAKAIPLGTMLGTFTGFVVYILVALKLSNSASQADLLSDQLIMSRIALFGSIIIPVGLAACTSSSALGAMLVAPRTLQAIATDGTFPFRKINLFLAKGKGKNNEPHNASLFSFAIALVFILLGDVNTVAEIISMFFLITYGTLCLSSFLNHFGSPPSYRPRFRSKWYISLAGFLLSVWVMFMISPLYTLLAYLLIITIYLFIEHNNKEKKGLVNIFRGALFQLNRHLQIYMQKHQTGMDKEEWRPAAVCISPNSLTRDKVLSLMKWISYQHGFGTYFHLIEGYYSKQTVSESKEVLEQLIQTQRLQKSTLYIDTMISPSYTSAIAQVIQSPSISGMENNLVVFEYDKRHPEELTRILENVNLVRAGDFDVCIFAGSEHFFNPINGIHVWIREADSRNTNFMILLGYIIMAHPYWKHSHIKIFVPTTSSEVDGVKESLTQRIAEGRLPITLNNIEILTKGEEQPLSQIVEEYSKNAGLTIIGFNERIIKHDATHFFSEFNNIGDVLFVNAGQEKEIN